MTVATANDAPTIRIGMEELIEQNSRGLAILFAESIASSAPGENPDGENVARLERNNLSMAKLILRFGNSVLKEMHVGQSGVRIGRSPDNGLMIDNQAVSHHHARVFTGTSGRLLLEDLGSMNGTFVNGRLARSVSLKPGDSIVIGKHNILVEDSRETCGFLT